MILCVFSLILLVSCQNIDDAVETDIEEEQAPRKEEPHTTQEENADTEEENIDILNFLSPRAKQGVDYLEKLGYSPYIDESMMILCPVGDGMIYFTGFSDALPPFL